MTKLLAIFTLMLLNSACSKKNEEVTYYPTGEVMCISTVDNSGILEGDSKCFFKNGVLKSVIPFHNHHINGIIKRYYPNGTLKSTEVIKNGHNFGLVQQFYSNGSLKYTTVLHNTIHVDTARLYFPNGNLNELIIYNNKGQQVDFKAWQLDRRVDPSYTMPIFITKSDTIKKGEDYSFEVVLGNRRSDNVAVKFLKPVTGLDSTNGTYSGKLYNIKQPKAGSHLVKIKVVENWSRKGSDTIWADSYEGAHYFLVK